MHHVPLLSNESLVLHMDQVVLPSRPIPRFCGPRFVVSPCPPVPVGCRKVARKGKQTTGKTCSAIPSDVVCAFSSASRDRKHADANADASPLILDLPVVKKLERIPSNARIADPFLTNLIALCRLEGVPLLLVAREGYRATGAEASHDGTDQVRRW